MIEFRSVRLWLVGWVLCVSLATLFPFDFSLDTRAEEQGPLGSSELSPLHAVVDLLLNVLLFMPLGTLLYNERRRRSVGLALLLVWAGAVAVGIALAVEYLQNFLPRRDPSGIDAAANVAGAILGAYLPHQCEAPIASVIVQLRRRISRTATVTMVTAVTVMALLVSGCLQARSRLTNWDINYALLVGNEQTGDRPWKGRVFGFELTDAPLSMESLRGRVAVATANLPGELVAAFDFSGEAPFRDTMQLVPDLHWTDRPAGSRSSGVRSDGRAWLQSQAPSSAIAIRLRKSNGFTLRLQCATDEVNQVGPARILSNSAGTLLRNFTVGQQGSDLVFRLRTPHTGSNASRPEFVVPQVFSDREPREILLSYDGATLLAVALPSERFYRMQLTPGSSLASTYLNLASNELRIFDLVYVAALFVLGGALIGLAGEITFRRVLAGQLWVAGFAPLLELTLTAASGRPFQWSNVAVSLAVGIALVPCSAIFISQKLRVLEI